MTTVNISISAEAISGGNLSKSVYSNGSNFYLASLLPLVSLNNGLRIGCLGGFEDKFEFDPQICGNLNRWTTEDIKEIPIWGSEIKSLLCPLKHSINWKTDLSTRFIDGLKYEDFHRYPDFCQNMGFRLSSKTMIENFINCLGIVHQKRFPGFRLHEWVK